MSSPETTANSLTITLFGPMQVRVQGQLLPPFRSRKALWVLALLTLRHSRPVEREWLAATLWPDLEQSQAFANLRPVLSELRRALGEEGARLQSPDRQTLLLEVGNANVDVARFDTAIKRGNLPELEQAVALYGGPLLEGCQEEWAGQERASREQKCLQALQKLGEAALNTPDYAAAIGYFQKAAILDAWSDAARRGWMEALAKQGDRNTALQVYREFLNILRSDPNAVPDEQTRALYERLRAEMRQQARTPPAVKAEMAATPRVTGYLPHALTDLVGREDERLEVAERLRRSRLVTLTGMGGIGKTRLAIEVASECVREYPDGVWLVALEALSDGKMVAQQIAFVLGLKEEPGRSLLQILKEHLRAKRLLLVLDNCEHLLEASAQTAASLLWECAEVHILATSREALGIMGETVWAVPSLAAPDPAHLPQANATLLRVLMGYESVQLFVERAQAMQKSFALTKSNALAVGQVCARLEGIPLALELAAARVKALPVEQIAARLDNELGLLTGGNRTAQSRQQTLRATLDWSYALLKEPERQLLRRLSVFVGGWRLEAAEAVCAGEGLLSSQVLDLLLSLIDKSLVVFGEQQDGEGRYQLLEMVRQYAAESLQASGEESAVRSRHSGWVLALAQEAERHFTQADQGVWVRRLETEHSNLRAALDRCGKEDSEMGLGIAAPLGLFWQLSGHCSEGREYLEQALKSEGAQGLSTLRAKAINGAGVLAYSQGDHTAARTLYEESLHMQRELGDRRAIAESLNNLANLAHVLGDYATIKKSYQETLQIFTELGDKRSMAWSLNGLSKVTDTLGDYASAQTLCEESLRIYRELEDKHGIARSLNNLGNILLQGHDYLAVRTLYDESLRLFQEVGDTVGIMLSLFGLGDLLLRQGEPAAAQVFLEESLSLCKYIGDRYTLAWILSSLGKSARLQCDMTLARAHYEEGLHLFQEMGDRMGASVALSGLGRLAMDQSDYIRSRSLYQDSLRLARDLSDREGIEENLKALAQILMMQTEVQKAVCLWSAAQTLRQSLGTVLHGEEQKIHDQELRQARLSLGEEAFDAAWDKGCVLTCEQAIVYALEKDL